MITALALAMTFVTMAQNTGRQPDGASDVLRAVAGAYDENRAKFPFGLAEFDYWDGYAKDLGAATRGDLTDAYAAKGLFAFDGKDALYSKLFSPEAMAAAEVRVSDKRSSRLDSFRVLTNGKSTFTERVGTGDEAGEVALGHIITPGSDDFYRFREFPLDLGQPASSRDDLAENIRWILDGKAETGVDKIEEDAIIDGVSTVRLALTFANGKRTYWVDLQRGAIPIRVRDDVVGGRSIDRHHGDIRLIEGRGWLPFSMTTYLNNGRVKRLVIKKAEFARAPARDLFQMKLSRPSPIVNVAAGQSYRQQTTVDLNHLSSPSSRDSAPFDKRQSFGPDPALPGEREPSRPYYTIAAIVLSVLIVGAAIWRRAKS